MQHHAQDHDVVKRRVSRQWKLGQQPGILPYHTSSNASQVPAIFHVQREMYYLSLPAMLIFLHHEHPKCTLAIAEPKSCLNMTA